MQIGILGSGDVAKALGRGFLDLGHEVMLGSRDASNPKIVNWAQGPKAKWGTFMDAAKFGEVLVMATLGNASVEACKLGGHTNFKGKLLIDATNPLNASKGFPPELDGSLGNSGAEKIQNAIPDGYVVKCFNTVGNALMYKPKMEKGLVPDMFICGNHGPAKEKAAKICQDFGWNAIDIGELRTAHYLEAMCLVWVLSAVKSGQWMQAFKLLKA